MVAVRSQTWRLSNGNSSCALTKIKDFKCNFVLGRTLIISNIKKEIACKNTDLQKQLHEILFSKKIGFIEMARSINIIRQAANFPSFYIFPTTIVKVYSRVGLHGISVVLSAGSDPT